MILDCQQKDYIHDLVYFDVSLQKNILIVYLLVNVNLNSVNFKCKEIEKFVFHHISISSRNTHWKGILAQGTSRRYFGIIWCIIKIEYRSQLNNNHNFIWKRTFNRSNILFFIIFMFELFQIHFIRCEIFLPLFHFPNENNWFLLIVIPCGMLILWLFMDMPFLYGIG